MLLGVASSWCNIPFDRVVLSPEVSMAFDPVQGGFLVEAAISWEVLGITPVISDIMPPS